MKNNIVVDNPVINLSPSDLPLNNIEIKKPNNLEIFWHVYGISRSYNTLNNKKAVMTLKARRGYRDSVTGDIKAIEKRMFHHNIIIFLESLDDLYYFDFRPLKFKERDIETLKQAYKKINIDAASYLEKAFY